VRRSSTVATARQGSAVEPSVAGPATERLPQSNGRHLGQSKGSEHAKGLDKPGHPVKKGAKGASATAPGQSKSPGKAEHAAAGEGSGHATAGSHPSHPEHPAHPEHPQAAPMPEAEAEPPAGTSPSDGTHGNAHAE